MKGYAQIAKNIRKIRQENGLTQEQLANKLNLSVMTIRRYEAATRTPTWKTLQDMAGIFGVSPNSLIIDDDEREQLKESPMNDICIKDNKIVMAIQLYENMEKDIKLMAIYSAYESLNEKGKYKALEYVLDVAKTPEYRKLNEAEKDDEN